MKNFLHFPKTIALSVAALTLVAGGAVLAENSYVTPETQSSFASGSVDPTPSKASGETIEASTPVVSDSTKEIVSSVISAPTATEASTPVVTDTSVDAPVFQVKSAPSVAIASDAVAPTATETSTPVATDTSTDAPATPTTEASTPAVNEAPTAPSVSELPAPVVTETPAPEAPELPEASYVSVEFSDSTSPEVKAAWAGDFSQFKRSSTNEGSSISYKQIDANSVTVTWGSEGYFAEATLKSNDINGLRTNYVTFLNKVLNSIQNAPVTGELVDASYVSVDFSEDTSPEVKAAWAGDYSLLERSTDTALSSSVNVVKTSSGTSVITWGSGKYYAVATVKSNDVEMANANYIKFLNKVLAQTTPVSN